MKKIFTLGLLNLIAAFSLISSPHELERLERKFERLHIREEFPPSWHAERPITPGPDVIILTQEQNLVFGQAKGDSQRRLQLFHHQSGTQGLWIENNRAIGATVTTLSRTAAHRTGKDTYIQYDKTRVETEGKDFEIKAENYRGYTNYQGGHIIDFKYSAGSSNREERNYFPTIYYYNSPLKEYLVTTCDEYIECPLYTSNPPRIGVKNQRNKFHDIPIGVLLVQLETQKIKDVFFFPNNDYDYEYIKNNLPSNRSQAATITPFFKLKKIFHQLLLPAFINATNMNFQREQEIYRLNTAADLMDGMTFDEKNFQEKVLARISFNVLHDLPVDIRDLLAINENNFHRIDQPALDDPFQELGKFLINYALGNALKSETLLTEARLIFLNTLVNCALRGSEKDEHALGFLNDLAKPFFKTSLKELRDITHTMTAEELTFLAHIYQKLCDPETEIRVSYALEESGPNTPYIVEDIVIKDHTKNYINVLKTLHEKGYSRNLSQFALLCETARKSIEHGRKVVHLTEEFNSPQHNESILKKLEFLEGELNQIDVNIKRQPKAERNQNSPVLSSLPSSPSFSQSFLSERSYEANLEEFLAFLMQTYGIPEIANTMSVSTTTIRRWRKEGNSMLNSGIRFEKLKKNYLMDYNQFLQNLK